MSIAEEAIGRARELHGCPHGAHGTSSHKRRDSRIIGAAIDVHRTLGPGLLESFYLTCLLYELRNAGLEAQKALPIRYKEVELDGGFREDLIVARAVIVEVKSVAGCD